MNLHMQHRNQFLDVFQQTIAMTSMMLDPQEVMETVVRELPRLLRIDACTIRLLEEFTQSFVLGAAHGVTMEYLSREAIDADSTMRMIRAGYPVYNEHVDEDRRLPFCDAARQEGIKAVLSLPILFQGQVIGVLRLLIKSSGRVFATEEIARAMGLAMQVGIAIAHGRMFRELQSQLAFSKELQDFSNLVNSTLDMDATLKNMAERATASLKAKGCTLRLVDPKTKKLYLAASHGLSMAYVQRGGVESERNIQLVLAGKPVSIYDVSHDGRVDYHEQMRAEGIVSLLAVPLQVQGEVIGVMRVLSSVPRVFTGAEINFASTLADVGSAAINNARSYQKIHLLLMRIEGHEKFLATIIDSLQHQLIVYNKDKRIALANQPFLSSVEANSEEVIGRLYNELCSDEEACPVNQVFAKENMQPFIQQLDHEEGIKWYERTASPVMGKNGDVDYVVEVIRDITSERRLVEAEVEKGRLSGIVEMAGTIAHEINSPLFAALGTVELMAEEDECTNLADDFQVVIRNLKKINTLTKKMTQMTGFRRKEYVGESVILSLDEEKNDGCISLACRDGAKEG